MFISTQINSLHTVSLEEINNMEYTPDKKDLFVNSFMRVAIAYAKPMAMQNDMDPEEVISAALEGVCVGVSKLPAQVSNSVYVIRIMKNYVMQYIQRNRYIFPVEFRREYDIPDTQSLDHICEDFNEPFSATIPADIQDNDTSVVESVLAYLNPLQREIWRKYLGLYDSPMPTSLISTEFNIGKERIRRIIRKSIPRIVKRLESRGIECRLVHKRLNRYLNEHKSIRESKRSRIGKLKTA